MNNLIVSPLHESRIDCHKWFETFDGKSARKSDRMLLTDADIVKLIRQFFFKNRKSRSRWHSSGNSDDLWILLGHLQKCFSKNFCISWRCTCFFFVKFSSLTIIRTASMKSHFVRKCRSITASLFRNDVNENRFSHLFYVFQGFKKQRGIVTIERAEITKANPLKNDRRDH